VETAPMRRNVKTEPEGIEEVTFTTVHFVSDGGRKV
jgi:hypothetical protein